MKRYLNKYIKQQLNKCWKNRPRTHHKRTALLCLLAGLIIIWPVVGSANDNQVKKKDVDKDGMIDQIAEFDTQGRLVMLAVDGNSDGVMDTFQYYVDGTVVRMEKDLDREPGIDMRYFFKDGRKVRQERLDQKGRIFQSIHLDAAGKPIEMHEDTTGDQRLDTVTFIEKGQIARVTRDPDGNGTPNTLALYQRGQLVERRMDENGDGSMDVHLFFDDHGQLTRRHLDTDQDGVLDLLEHYRNGLVSKQQWDQNQDGRYERVAFFEKGDIVRIEEDSDMDGIRETTVAYRGGKPMVRTMDANQDGKIELRIIYHLNGETERIEKDISSDGNMDTFQVFINNRLSSVEKDTNADGDIDTKISYDTGRQTSIMQDHDHDGRFETRHWYDRSPWTRVTELDSDANGDVDVRSYFIQDIIGRRETLTKDGNGVELQETFDEKGRLVKSLQDRNMDGRWDMTWHYNAQGNVARAEEDANADQRVDHWYYYKDGRLSGVSEDSNGDGQPDIWEDYNTSQTMTQRKKDLDFDGVVDIKETY